MPETSPQVIVIAGSNGASKTTLAPFLLRDMLGVLEYVNADPIALGLSGFDPASMSFEAGRIMLGRCITLRNDAIALRLKVPWPAALTRPGSRDSRPRVIDFICSFCGCAALSWQLRAERVRGGGHFVPEEVIRRRYRRSLINFFSLYQPLADTWSTYDNSGSGTPLLVSAGGEKIRPRIVRPDTWDKLIEARK